MNGRDTLTAEQIEAAWRRHFRCSLDEHPDGEIAWEARTWRALGADTAAVIAETILVERRANDFTMPGGADAADLDLLLSRVDLQPVLRLCRDEALCLLAALRLVYWSGLRRVER